MIELVQLERRHDDFPKRNTRVLVVSVEGLDDARKTQADFPHLIVLADQAAQLVRDGRAHPSPRGTGWRRRRRADDDPRGPARHRALVISFARGDWRLSPDDVLRAIDRHIP